MVVFSEENIRPDFELVDERDSAAMSDAKRWLFKENMRLINLSKELDERAQSLEKETDSLKAELKSEMSRLKVKESQLILQKKHVDDQLVILRRGFEELNADRAAFEEKQKKLVAFRPASSVSGTVFFNGINSENMLKKRYRDLMKIFHPDNANGDEETLLLIKNEFEEIKNNF